MGIKTSWTSDSYSGKRPTTSCTVYKAWNWGCFHSYSHSSAHSCIRWRLFGHSLKHSLTHSFTHSLIHLLIFNSLIFIYLQSQINFSREVVNCLKNPRSKDSLVSMRNKLVSSLTPLSELVTSPLSEYKRIMVVSLLTLEVHGRDIIDMLIENQVAQPEDFEWSRWIYSVLVCLADCQSAKWKRIYKNKN